MVTDFEVTRWSGKTEENAGAGRRRHPLFVVVWDDGVVGSYAAVAGARCHSSFPRLPSTVVDVERV